MIDTNGDGVITKPWNEPNGAGEVEMDPTRDTRVGSLDKFQRAYGIIPHPDGRRSGSHGGSRCRDNSSDSSLATSHPKRVSPRSTNHRTIRTGIPAPGTTVPAGSMSAVMG